MHTLKRIKFYLSNEIIRHSHALYTTYTLNVSCVAECVCVWSCFSSTACSVSMFPLDFVAGFSLTWATLNCRFESLMSAVQISVYFVVLHAITGCLSLVFYSIRSHSVPNVRRHTARIVHILKLLLTFVFMSELKEEEKKHSPIIRCVLRADCESKHKEMERTRGRCIFSDHLIDCISHRWSHCASILMHFFSPLRCSRCICSLIKWKRYMYRMCLHLVKEQQPDRKSERRTRTIRKQFSFSDKQRIQWNDYFICFIPSVTSWLSGAHRTRTTQKIQSIWLDVKVKRRFRQAYKMKNKWSTG